MKSVKRFSFLTCGDESADSHFTFSKTLPFRTANLISELRTNIENNYLARLVSRHSKSKEMACKRKGNGKGNGKKKEKRSDGAKTWEHIFDESVLLSFLKRESRTYIYKLDGPHFAFQSIILKKHSKIEVNQFCVVSFRQLHEKRVRVADQNVGLGLPIDFELVLVGEADLPPREIETIVNTHHLLIHGSWNSPSEYEEAILTKNAKRFFHECVFIVPLISPEDSNDGNDDDDDDDDDRVDGIDDRKKKENSCILDTTVMRNLLSPMRGGLLEAVRREFAAMRGYDESEVPHVPWAQLRLKEREAISGALLHSLVFVPTCSDERQTLASVSEVQWDRTLSFRLRLAKDRRQFMSKFGSSISRDSEQPFVLVRDEINSTAKARKISVPIDLPWSFEAETESWSHNALVFSKVQKCLGDSLNSFDKIFAFEEEHGIVFEDKHLLREAFTHSTYAHEFQDAIPSYERLEFLGDAVLEVLATEKAISCRDLPMNEIYLLKKHLTCNQTLREVSLQLGLSKYLLFSGQPVSDQSKVHADLVEAIVGATFVSKGWEACEELLDRWLFVAKIPEFMTYSHEIDLLAASQHPESYVLALQEKDAEKMLTPAIHDMERILGFTFRSRAFLIESLTYTPPLSATWSSQSREPTRVLPPVHNLRLSFMGTAVMKYMVSVYVFFEFPSSNEQAYSSSTHSFLNRSRTLTPVGIELGIPKSLLFSPSEHPELLRHGCAMREACSIGVFSLFGALYFMEGTWRKGALDGWIQRGGESRQSKSSIAQLMEKKIFCHAGYNPVNIMMDDVRKLNTITQRYFTPRLPDIRTKISRLRVGDDVSVDVTRHSKESGNVELSHSATVSISRVKYGKAMEDFVPELEEEIVLSEASGYATKDEARSTAVSDALRFLKHVLEKYFASQASATMNLDGNDTQDQKLGETAEKHMMKNIGHHEDDVDCAYVYVDFSPYDMSAPFPYDHVVDVHDRESGKKMYRLKVLASGEIHEKEDVEEEEEEEAMMEEFAQSSTGRDRSSFSIRPCR
eukprot:TRINITY_DN928_c3_g1_i1.p1 TRINITY_DN928_c3_g1~~TRINITY_DN928_c3_g1_i1.p1  ORF type:complete len:1025 (-),score=297.79 TRINITY_DN928_c3_g1_i1:1312-4386(-)